jgi:hypothetical protein
MRFGKLFQEWICSRQVVGYDTLWPNNFVYRFAWIWANLAADCIFVLTRTHHRFSQVNRIRNDGHERHTVFVTDEMFDDGRSIAARNTVTANPTFFQMRRVDS